MSKITKQAAFLEQLHSMVTKEASAGKATGKPGADTHPVSVSEKTEHVDKNKEGKPEHNPQEVKQHAASDPSDPTKTHKTAEELEAEKQAAESAAKQMPGTEIKAKAPGKDSHKAEEAPNKVEQKEAAELPAALEAKNKKHEAVESKVEEKLEHKKAGETPTNEKLAELANSLLSVISNINKEAEAGKTSGKPGADTHPTSVSEKTEHVNKNEQGKPEHNPQEVKQHAASDPSDPTKAHHKAAEQADLDKEASFELGRQFARTFLTTKTASQADMLKTAGKRDFEQLIAQAAEELEQETAPEVQKQASAQVDNEALQIKQAEDAGAAAFHALFKQAQEEEQANQYKLAFEQQINKLMAEKQAAEQAAYALSVKVAAHEADMQKKAEEDKLDAKLAQWGRFVVEDVISKLKSEPAGR